MMQPPFANGAAPRRHQNLQHRTADYTRVTTTDNRFGSRHLLIVERTHDYCHQSYSATQDNGLSTCQPCWTPNTLASSLTLYTSLRNFSDSLSMVSANCGISNLKYDYTSGRLCLSHSLRRFVAQPHSVLSSKNTFVHPEPRRAHHVY